MWRERGRGGRDGGAPDQRGRRPGYGELCRHLHRHLRRQMDDHEAYGESRQRRDDRDTLAEKIGDTLGKDRFNLADLPQLLDLTIDYLDREPELQSRLRKLAPPLSSSRKSRSSASPRRSRSPASPRRSRSPRTPRTPSATGDFSRRSRSARRSRSSRSASRRRLPSTGDYSPQGSSSSISQRTPSPSPTPTPPPSITSLNAEPVQEIDYDAVANEELMLKKFAQRSSSPPMPGHGSRSRSSSPECSRPPRKMSKFDSLRPISAFLEGLLVNYGSPRTKADLVVFDITDRLVTAGYNWDKTLMCHAKGRDKFCKKLIPHIFMSKDDFPPDLDPDVILNKVYFFIDEWKQKLFDLLSGKALNMQNQMGQEISKTPNGAEFGRAMDFPKREAHIKETDRDETKCQLIKQDQKRHSTTRQPSVERQSFSSNKPKESERIVQWSRRDRSKVEEEVVEVEEIPAKMQRQDGERSPGSQQRSHPEHRVAKNDQAPKRRNETSRSRDKSSSTSRTRPSREEVKGKRGEESSKKIKLDGERRRGHVCAKDTNKNKAATSAKKGSRTKPKRQEQYIGSESSSGSDSEEVEEEEEEDDDDDEEGDEEEEESEKQELIKMEQRLKEERRRKEAEREAERKRKDAEQDAEKRKKEAERDLDRRRREAERDMDKRRKDAEREVNRRRKDAEREVELREELLKRMHTKDTKGKNNGEEDLKASASPEKASKAEQEQNDRTLLEKVNEIIKSCVKLKEDKGISEEKLKKANKIIEKAEEKKKRLMVGKTKEERDNEEVEKEAKTEGNREKSEDKEEKEEMETEQENEELNDDGRRTPLAYRRDRARSESASEFELEVSLDSKIKEHLEDEEELKIVVKPLPEAKDPDVPLEDGEITQQSSEVEEVVQEQPKKDPEGRPPSEIEKALEEEVQKLSNEVKEKRNSREKSDDMSKSSVTEELQAMAGKSNRRAEAASRRRHYSSSRSKSRTRSRSRSHSRSRSRSHSRGRDRYNYNREWDDRRWRGRREDYRGGDNYRGGGDNQRYRERSPGYNSQQWIPLTPCAILEDIDLGPGETKEVAIRAKGEFSFKDNPGCMVRITKWTGKDSMSSVQIRPQIVELDDRSSVMIEVSNPHSERNMELLKHDKIACLSVLSAPAHPSIFRGLRCSPDRYQTDNQRWFKVTTVVLHKKGNLDRISIHPGRTMRVIATVIGPLKKHVGKTVMISQLDGYDGLPIDSQVAKICENECIGFNVTNRRERTISVEKGGQSVATLSVWATVRMDDDPVKNPY